MDGGVVNGKSDLFIGLSELDCGSKRKEKGMKGISFRIRV